MKQAILFVVLVGGLLFALLATGPPTAECNALSCWGSCRREADCGRDCRCVRFSSERDGFCRRP